MKKYFAAAAVAVMVFAFSAFAAELQLGDSTLAAGQANVRGCDLAVVSWGYESDDESAHNVVLDEGDLYDCAGTDAQVFVDVLGSGDAVIGGGSLLTDSSTWDADGRVTVSFDSPVLAEDIKGIKAVVHTKSA